MNDGLESQKRKSGRVKGRGFVCALLIWRQYVTFLCTIVEFEEENNALGTINAKFPPFVPFQCATCSTHTHPPAVCDDYLHNLPFDQIVFMCGSGMWQSNSFCVF